MLLNQFLVQGKSAGLIRSLKPERK